jgi:hypothetical protein
MEIDYIEQMERLMQQTGYDVELDGADYLLHK